MLFRSSLHLADDLSLIRLGELSFFNPSYLSRLFKQKTGQNLSDFISGLKMEQAMLFLRDNSLKISDVANRLGFESQHYFSRFFKKNTGRTPQEYREQLMP